MVLVCIDFLYFVSTAPRRFVIDLLTGSRIPSGGITTFGPLIVNSFGFNAFNTILLNIPFGAVQIIATMGGAVFATRTKRKGPALALLCIPPIAGIVMLLCIKHTAANKGSLLVGYYLVCHSICTDYPFLTSFSDLVLPRHFTSHLLLVIAKHCR
jgi:hypothetical protein